jgi:hypothetical protein
VDLCTDKTNPIDCASISTCQFVANPSGGKCVTAPTANPCAGLGAAGCALNPACQAVQRYVKPRKAHVPTAHAPTHHAAVHTISLLAVAAVRMYA